jgi:L-threonylcarbamoyladenylate synthase
MVAKYVKEIPSIAIDLVEVNDAPMTIIYPGAIAGAPESEGDRWHLAHNTVAEDGSVGIRIPLVPEEDEPEAGPKKAAPKGNLTAGAFCRELVRRLRHPLVSTSANISGEPTPESFAEISEEIKAAVDFVVPKPFGAGATGRSSQIIKLGLDGEVEILRP